jgi:predicted RecB family nuclease
MDITVPHANTQNILFMIGIMNRKKEYTALSVAKLNAAEERRVCLQFIKMVGKGARCFHWAPAEVVVWKKMCEKHGIKNDIVWIDMCKVFKQEPIVIKGCFSFSLKAVAGALYQHGLIGTRWEDDIGNGVEAMLCAHRIYEQAEREKLRVQEYEDFKQLVMYNKTDVRVLYDIVYFLRTRTQ